MEEKLTAGPVTNNDDINNNDVAIVVAVPMTDHSDGSINGDKKKKKRGGYSLFKAARLMFRGKLGEKAKPQAIQDVDCQVASKGADSWKKIVGSMRPLTLQEVNPSPPSSPSPASASASASPLRLMHEGELEQPSEEQYEDVLMMPTISPSISSSSISSMSQYASALNLQELDNHEESDDNEDEDHVFDNKPADAMIDAKAEEFIAHFYAQMRRQQMDSAHRTRELLKSN